MHSIYFDCSVIGSSSEKGNIVRLYNTKKGELMQEQKVDRSNASIYNINFSLGSIYLLVSTDEGRVRVFVVNNKVMKIDLENNYSMLLVN